MYRVIKLPSRNNFFGQFQNKFFVFGLLCFEKVFYLKKRWSVFIFCFVTCCICVFKGPFVTDLGKAVYKKEEPGSNAAEELVDCLLIFGATPLSKIVVSNFCFFATFPPNPLLDLSIWYTTILIQKKRKVHEKKNWGDIFDVTGYTIQHTWNLYLILTTQNLGKIKSRNLPGPFFFFFFFFFFNYYYYCLVLLLSFGVSANWEVEDVIFVWKSRGAEVVRNALAKNKQEIQKYFGSKGEKVPAVMTKNPKSVATNQTLTTSISSSNSNGSNVGSSVPANIDTSVTSVTPVKPSSSRSNPFPKL